jgi:hypothetical protein
MGASLNDKSQDSDSLSELSSKAKIRAEGGGGRGGDMTGASLLWLTGGYYIIYFWLCISLPIIHSVIIIWMRWSPHVWILKLGMCLKSHLSTGSPGSVCVLAQGLFLLHKHLLLSWHSNYWVSHIKGFQGHSQPDVSWRGHVLVRLLWHFIRSFSSFLDKLYFPILWSQSKLWGRYKWRPAWTKSMRP